MRYLILLILTLQTVRTHKNILPGFLIDHGGVMSPHIKIDTNPFSKITTPHFAYILQQAMKRCEVVIMFIEEEFCVEDVSTKDKLGTPYQYLHKNLLEGKVKYMPGVIEPYKLLNHMFQPHEFNVFYLSSGTKLQLQIFDGHFKYFYVFFKDGVNETRAEKLRRHDLIMEEVYFVIRQLAAGEVVAFYTGKINPIVVQKINYAPTERTKAAAKQGVFVESDSAIYRFVGVSSETPTRRASFTQVPMVTEETWYPTALSNKMAYIDFDLEFFFSFKDKEWMLEYVRLIEGDEEVGRTDMRVGAPWSCAYYCNEPLVIINQRDGSSVTILEYQIKPLGRRRKPTRRHYYRRQGGTATDTTPGINGGNIHDDTTTATSVNEWGNEENPKEFGNTVHCGPYFTAGILACLFVSAICFSILACGMILMNDCMPNDKYDKAQGKPLTINAEGPE